MLRADCWNRHPLHHFRRRVARPTEDHRHSRVGLAAPNPLLNIAFPFGFLGHDPQDSHSGDTANRAGPLLEKALVPAIDM
jgi:hypothetical protein